MQRGPTAADKAAAAPRPKRVRGSGAPSGPEEAGQEAGQEVQPSVAAISDLPPQPAPKKRRHERQREQAQQAQQAQQARSKGSAGTDRPAAGAQPAPLGVPGRSGVSGSSDGSVQPSVEAGPSGTSAPLPAGKQQKEVHGRSVLPEA